MRSGELALESDLANVSDAAVRKDVDSLEYYALEALADATTGNGLNEEQGMANAYSNLLTRCGQLIQGQ